MLQPGYALRAAPLDICTMRRSEAAVLAAATATDNINGAATFRLTDRPIAFTSCPSIGPTGCNMPALLMSRTVCAPSTNRTSVSVPSHPPSAAEFARSSSTSCKRGEVDVLLFVRDTPSTAMPRDSMRSTSAAPSPRVWPVRIALIVFMSMQPENKLKTQSYHEFQKARDPAPYRQID